MLEPGSKRVIAISKRYKVAVWTHEREKKHRREKETGRDKHTWRRERNKLRLGRESFVYQSFQKGLVISIAYKIEDVGGKMELYLSLRLRNIRVRDMFLECNVFVWTKRMLLSHIALLFD